MELDEPGSAAGVAAAPRPVIKSGGKYGYPQGDPYRLRHVIVDGKPAYAVFEGLLVEGGWLPRRVPRKGDPGVKSVRFFIRELPFEIGRSKVEEHLPQRFGIPNQRVSKSHCVIDFEPRKKGWTITVLGRNPILVNKRDVDDTAGHPTPLPSRSTLRIGPLFGYFLLPADAARGACAAPGAVSLEQQLFWTQQVGVKIPASAVKIPSLVPYTAPVPSPSPALTSSQKLLPTPAASQEQRPALKGSALAPSSSSSSSSSAAPAAPASALSQAASSGASELAARAADADDATPAVNVESQEL